ncbi:MAG: hypothetical protein AAFO94_04805 [Bacteroidota bacterium]
MLIMASFEESGLRFSFPENWWVRKFDESRFYNYVNGYGVKGVDFMIITPDKELILLEVKNYRTRFKAAKEHPTTQLLKGITKFSKNLAHKFSDSILLIEAIHEYSRRRLWRRLLVNWWVDWLPKDLRLNSRSGFWNEAYHLLDSRHAHLMLWLEMDLSKSGGSRKVIDTKVQKIIDEDFPNLGFSIQYMGSTRTKIQATPLTSEQN